MRKRFNITGTCVPHKHYMMDNQRQFNEVLALVEEGMYFTINRPRQYGKTTMLFQMSEYLKKSEEYLPIKLNFQGVGEKWHRSDGAFAQMFFLQIAKDLERSYAELLPLTKNVEIQTVEDLSYWISAFIRKVGKEVVLLIDEVDASSNYDSFLSFLGMLRAKYLARDFEVRTFHSVILAGVHDIKNLKFKLRNPEAAQYNSPWNIAINFKVRMSFIPKEIVPMLEDYCQAEKVAMDIPTIAERLYYHTSGYPFLVSRLCKMIAEEILPHRNNKKWTVEDVENAVQLLLMEDNPNFDSVINHLKNNEDLYNLVFRMIINGDSFTFNLDNTTIQKGVTYGIFKANGRLKIHNRVYEQRFYNFLTSTLETRSNFEDYSYRHQFLLENNTLDLQKLLLKFQQFIKEQYSNKDRNFLEREWRLLFLAFLQPTLNGHGYAFKEPQFEAEKRLDVVITYYEHRYIVELKKWYGAVYHEKGVAQLANYLEVQGLEKGYLVIFDNRKNKAYTHETIQYGNKEIFAVSI